ncbi:MAG TPA: sulfatase-like hydrolase/transferase [Thermoplasmata archaeon]|nr:sulfatase-like hydrolase/transferase [Thermoplasmata archaeon]
MNRPADVVVVVLDCVRATELENGPSGRLPYPFLTELRSESVVFPRTASVGHWTLPAHASLFTGLYPWVHGLYQGGAKVLGPELPLAARWLRRGGYRTASFSANRMVNPSHGWLEGFGYAAWGSSSYLRSSSPGHPPRETGNVAGPIVRRAEIPEGLQRAGYWGVVGLERFPAVLDRLARFEARIRGDGRYRRPVMAPWIEGSFDRWVRGTPANEPLFAFVNLLDAHEPYLLDREDGFSRADLAEAARVRQDHHGWIEGRWRPTPREGELLHRLYQGTIRLLDQRLRSLVASLREHGRWENTLFILTSDHGQAFGEHDLLYHLFGISNEVVQVPLWVRFPHGMRGGATGHGWTSLVDVAPTVADVTGVPGIGALEGLPLTELVESERKGPVYALADGSTFGEPAPPSFRWRGLREDYRALAAFQGRWKAVMTLPARRVAYYDLTADPQELRPLDPSATSGAPDLGGGLGRIADQLDSQHHPDPPDSIRHLRAWGYVD